MLKYLFACIRGLRIKKCKSSCMDFEIEASPVHTPKEEDKEVKVFNI